MLEKIKTYINMLTDRIPKEKRPIVAVVCGIVLMGMILLSDFSANSNTVETDENNYCDYAQIIETKLEEIVSSIDGAGNTKVMVTLDSSEENIYATDITEDKNEYVVIKTSSQEGGLLLKIIQPKIRGVAIVCDGGDSYRVQNDIIKAVRAVLDISSSGISISKMK